MKMISLKDFSFKYHNLNEYTLIHINLEIEEGEKVLITGRSGSGKSTLAHCINGLIPYTYKGQLDGEIRIHDQVPAEHSLFEMGSYVGTILQDQDCQFVGLSAGEDAAFALENDCVPTDQMHQLSDDALALVDMLEHKNIPPDSLSGGQKQKVAIAGILAMKAPILLFDEPLANLDPASGKKAMETINRLHDEQHKTILVIEHRIEDVLEHGFDRVVIIDEGKVAYNGTPDDLLAGGTLPKLGLRQPLYVEMLQFCGAELRPEDKISKIENTLKYKDQVVTRFMEDTFDQQEPSTEVVLKVENVCYKYYKEDPYTIQDISFQVNKGEIIAIVGNNGAGKSTLLKAISGLAKYQEGHIYYQGECIDGWSIKKRASSIGYVMQNPNHMITKTMIFDEVAFGPRNFGMSEEKVEAAVDQALHICGLEDYRNWPTSALSYGQKKRLTIASILAMGPKIIIMDEPTAGQDYTSYREFMLYLSKIKEKGISIILITHDMHLALEYADRGVVLSQGRVVQQNTMDKILSDQELINQANLKHTSIEKMGRLFGVEDLSSFIAYFTRRVSGGAEYE